MLQVIEVNEFVSQKDVSSEISFTYETSHLICVAMSSIVFLILHRIILPIFSHFYTVSYARITSSQRIEWDMRFTSSIFASVVGLISMYILLFDNGLSSSPVL